MLRFKQFIELLSEAKFEDFPFLDPENAEHKNMLDAYNKGSFPKSKISKIKTIDHLRDIVSSQLGADAAKKKVFDDGDIRLVHHDSNTGLKIFKVYNHKGSAESYDLDTGKKISPEGWCTGKADPDTGEIVDAVSGYDKSASSSYIIRIPKEQLPPDKRKLTHIGIFGVDKDRPHKDGAGGNFQDVDNKTISDEDWDFVRNKFGLDKIPHMMGIRGVESSTENQRRLSDELVERIRTKKVKPGDITHAKTNGYLDEKVHIPLLQKWLLSKISKGKISLQDMEHAKTNGYLTPNVSRAFYDAKKDQPREAGDTEHLADGLAEKLKSGEFESSDVFESKEGGYWNDKLHIPAAKEGLAKKIQNEGIHSKYVIHAKNHGYWNENIHAPLAKSSLRDILRSGQVNYDEIDKAKKHGYWDDTVHIPAAKEGFAKQLAKGDILNESDILHAKKHGYWDDIVHIPAAKEGLAKYLKSNPLTDKVMNVAKNHGYWDAAVHSPSLKTGFTSLLSNGIFSINDIQKAIDGKYYDEKLHKPLVQKNLTDVLRRGDFSKNDINHAINNNYWDEKVHLPAAQQGFTEKLLSKKFDNSDVEHAKDNGYYVPSMHDKLYKDWLLTPTKSAKTKKSNYSSQYTDPYTDSYDDDDRFKYNF